MKKLFLLATIFCMLTAPFLKAQISQGNIMVGVSSVHQFSGAWGSDFMALGFTSSKNISSTGTASEPDKEIGVVFLPKVGYLLTDNIAAGLEIITGYYNETDGSDNDKYISTLISLGPFVRYYLLLDKFNPFVELNAGFGIEKNKYDAGSFENEYKYTLFSFGGGAGLVIPLGERVTFDVLAGYNNLTYKEKVEGETGGKNKYGTFGLKMGFMVYFGIK